MSRILVIEDEIRYQRALVAALESPERAVVGVASPRGAIDEAIAGWPDVVVVDWMLGDRIDGLSLLDAMWMVAPSFRAILITGYPGVDLSAKLRVRPEITLLRKPFRLADLRGAVGSPAPAQSSIVTPAIGFLVADTDGSLRFCNDYVRSLAGHGVVPRRVSDLFELERWGEPRVDWHEARAVAGDLASVQVTWRREDDSRVRVVVARERHVWRAPAVVPVLLGSESGDVRGEAASRTVVVTDSSYDGRCLAAAVRQRGCLAMGCEGAIDYVRRQRAGCTVVVHWTSEQEVSRCVRAIRRIGGKRAFVVGSGPRGSAGRFRRLGVSCVVEEPWSLADLEAAITPPREAGS